MCVTVVETTTTTATTTRKHPKKVGGKGVRTLDGMRIENANRLSSFSFISIK